MANQHETRYTAQEKREAVALSAEVGPAEAARRLGIPAGTVSCWRHLARLPGCTVICGDATTHDFARPFDAIVLSNVLEHIADRVAFLQRLRAHSARFLIRVPMIDRDWISLYKEEQGVEHRLDRTHTTEYTLKQLKDELRQTGLKIKRHRVRYGELYAVVGLDPGADPTR